jgi:hypothetical protein
MAKAEKAKSKRAKAAKRELISTGTDERNVRRGAKGQFKESDDVGRSLRGDRRRKAKTKAKRGRRQIVDGPTAMADALIAHDSVDAGL